MHKFSLFKKSTKFYWSTNRIIYLILFVASGLLLLKNEVFHFEKNIIDKILLFVLVSTIIGSLLTMFKGLTEVKPLRGTLDGDLIFDENFIQVKEEIFPIEQIRKIQISNEDYSGKFQSSRGNFGPALSNGTNNFVIIFLESNKTRKFQYELLNSNDFQKIRQILIGYHLKGKIDFWEVTHVLGEKSSAEIRDFTIEIEKMNTAAKNDFV